MKLVNGFDLMEYAKEKGYVLPAFNTTNMEMTFAIVRGLNEAKLPGYVQISSNNLRLSDPQTIAYLVEKAQRDQDTPIGLHLDHGKSFEDVKACVDAGFTSIMIDASQLPYDENIAAVRRAADYCHFYGIPVEAELGAIGGKEDDIVNESNAKTNPDMVADFVERTRCDTLAVAVGNVHGLVAKPHIDLPLLAKLAAVSPVPLVLHGGSGIPFETIREARKHNLIKINYGADLRSALVTTFGQAYEKDHKECNLIELSLSSVEHVAERAKFLVEVINGKTEKIAG
ncbi:class II aldolase [Mitsuokella sp.]|uniref:class II aldolase n=1 Tax=Mitsuokella sp. TaxID=2049034 RepID=UPI002A833950|nr:class II aldolase [Mitsuokella sp.]MDY4474820.1 class II aldolase [Mitsuokella sp.]